MYRITRQKKALWTFWLANALQFKLLPKSVSNNLMRHCVYCDSKMYLNCIDSLNGELIKFPSWNRYRFEGKYWKLSTACVVISKIHVGPIVFRAGNNKYKHGVFVRQINELQIQYIQLSAVVLSYNTKIDRYNKYRKKVLILLRLFVFWWVQPSSCEWKKWLIGNALQLCH